MRPYARRSEADEASEKKNAGLSLEIRRQNIRPTTVKRPNIACDDSVDTGCASECMCPTMT